MAFAKILRLQDMEGIILTEEKIDGIQERFKKHIADLNSNDLSVEKEKLCYHIQNEEQRINSSINKLNIYATIILTVLPLILAVIDLKGIITLPFPLLVGVAFIVYSLVNICAYVFRAIKVQGIMKSSFSDLRSSQEKEKEILSQYQYDWQQLKYKAQLFVSFVLNVQDWVVLMLVLAVGVSIGITFRAADNGMENKEMDRGEVITLNIEAVDEPYSSDAIEWKELLLDIERESYKHIIFIGNYDEMPAFINELERYEDLEVKILQDSQMSKTELKVIREE